MTYADEIASQESFISSAVSIASLITEKSLAACSSLRSGLRISRLPSWSKSFTRFIGASYCKPVAARKYAGAVAEPSRDEGDPELRRLFERFNGQLVSPGGAAALLGVSRSTVATLTKRGKLRAFRSDGDDRGRLVNWGPKWVFIPLIDLKRYAEQVGRPFPEFPFGMNVDDTDA
jgi:excisionase family DNA binding protein